MRFRSIMLCAAVAPLLVAGEPQPLRLQPSSPWDLNYAENSCQLIRTFGEGKQKVAMLLESPAPGRMTMLAFGKPLQTSLQEVPAKFVPAEARPMMGGPANATGSGDPAILWSTVSLEPDSAVSKQDLAAALKAEKAGVRPPPIDLNKRAAERAARQTFISAVKELEIDTRPGRPVILETGSVGDAIAAFDKCGRDSLKDWGVDPDLEDKIAKPVWAPDPSRWFSSNDYPEGMMIRGEESEVSARLLVDATGKVTSCTSLSHFDAPDFNKAVCDKFKARAHFEPAELADGTKVPSYYTAHVVFRVRP